MLDLIYQVYKINLEDKEYTLISEDLILYDCFYFFKVNGIIRMIDKESFNNLKDSLIKNDLLEY